mgnify:CR=1 FL=1|tara:strand:+ start:291 stop:812 length:522 start_codon:yes stop_codon:yes gene_type:complete
MIKVVTLSVFSLFIGCSNPFESSVTPIEFEIDSGMTVDDNGYHHMTIDRSRWQTLHRISGVVTRDDITVNVVKFNWGSNLYWTIGDTLGYVIANNGLTDDLVYVGYDTTYITWFTGFEVPIINSASYSNEDGEVSTMIAPVRNMIGDTATIFLHYFDSYYGTEYEDSLYVVFD